MEDKCKNLMLIGCGKVSETGHLPAIFKSRRSNLIALVDKHINNATRLKKRYSINAPVVRDMNSIKDKVDGAIIATPNNTHYTIARSCLEKKIPVLVEKPLCNTTEEAESLCELATQQNTFISVGYTTRYYPNVSLFKELLEKGYFGKLESFGYEFGSVGGWDPVSGYNIDKKKSGGGVLVITGTHILDRLLYWFGIPKSLQYWDDSHGGVEANCKAQFYYNNKYGNFSGNIFLSKTTKLKNRFIIESENFTCEIIEGQSRTITLFPKAETNLKYEVSERDVSDQGAKLPFELQLDNFIDCIEGMAVPTVNGEAAKHSITLMENMYSMKEPMEEPWVLRI